MLQQPSLGVKSGLGRMGETVTKAKSRNFLKQLLDRPVVIKGVNRGQLGSTNKVIRNLTKLAPLSMVCLITCAPSPFVKISLVVAVGLLY